MGVGNLRRKYRRKVAPIAQSFYYYIYFHNKLHDRYLGLFWQVNLAIILDGSFSLHPADIVLEQGFAKEVVAAFAERNLFENGGTASYVEYSILVAPGTHLFGAGTFLSAEDFNNFVDFDGQSGGGTTNSIGIDEGRESLAANPATASFMVVITGGQSESISNATATAADAARAEGVVVFAVGAGEFLAASVKLQPRQSCYVPNISISFFHRCVLGRGFG